MSADIGAALTRRAPDDWGAGPVLKPLETGCDGAPVRAMIRLTKAVLRWFIQGIVLATLGIIMGIWVHGGGVTGIAGWAILLTSAGRLTGLLGAYLLILQLLALARIPFLEWAVGFDRLTALHRSNGKLCLSLILAHVGLVTAGYAIMSRISIPAQFLLFLTGYHGMVAALAGTILLVLVIITSLVVVRRRLRYESWYFVHLLAYVGVLLAWFHQVPTGTLFLANPWATAFWTALYFLTLQFVVIFRFVQPVVRSFLHRLEVAEVVEEASGLVSIRITGRHLDYLNARAGQFFQWRFLDRSRWWQSHPFSLSEAPDGHSFRITIKDLGDFSRGAKFIKPGTRVVAEGPFGSFTDQVRVRDGVALLAAGVGITPIRALLEGMRGDITLIYRATRYADIIFRPELKALAEERGARLYYLTGDRRRPENRHYLSPQHLRELVPDIRRRDVYLCGPPSMMETIERSIRRVGVPEHQIHRDDFAF